MHEAELAQEREYVHGLYHRLDELREEKHQQLAKVRRDGGRGTMQNVSERDAFASLYEDRLAQLDAVEDRLVFGRLDLDEGEKQYIGRIGLSTEDLQRLMVDWRAPEAGHFYQATAFDRQGVRRRRHLILQGRELKAMEDDVLDPGLLAESGTHQGEGALLAALNSRRTGQMSDIVGTIQAEQDRIIRSGISGAMVVQGGPGTGKTAVALHRAAYLLYTHRERLKNAGVLLVGPSSSFMKYIERVLPSLGETGVVMASLGRLMPGISAVPERNPEVAELKGQGFMAKVVANAVFQRQRTLAASQTVVVEGYRLTVTPKQVSRARDKARQTGKPHNEARGTFVKIMLRELTEQLTEQVLASNPGNSADRSYLAEDVRSSHDVRILLNLAWMPMTAEQLITELFAKDSVLKVSAPHLSDAQRSLLRREPGAPWTEADVPLLDEAAELLGDLDVNAARNAATAAADRQRDLENAKATIRNMEHMGMDALYTAEEIADANAATDIRLSAADRARTDRTWAYGHVVVDEAQELSHMQWRLLARRCPLKSFTIVGDIAQTSSAAGAQSWAGALAPEFGTNWRLEELTVNYRTPAQIAEAAVRMANAAGQIVSAPKAVREGNWPLIVNTVAASDIVPSLVSALPEELSALDGGLLAVIATEPARTAAESALREVYGERIGRGSGSYDQDIVVITPQESKGLEFDGVVILEPQDLLDAAAGRVGDLYVAMTRPTQRLRLIASRPLPAGIEED